MPVHQRRTRTLLVAALSLGTPAGRATLVAQVAPAATPVASPAAQAPAPATQAAPAPRPRSPWRFAQSVALQDITGNKKLRLIQSAIRVERLTPDRVNLTFKLEGGYGTSGGTGELERRVSSNLRFDWTPRALVSPFLGFDWEYNRVLRLNARVNGGAGANINFVYRDSARVTLALGLVEEYKNVAARDASPGSVSNDTRLHVRLALARTLRSGVQLEANAKFQPVARRLADYLFKVDGTLRVALTTKLRWETTYRWWRDSTPASGVQMDDRALISGLAVQW
jgi:hypothetical protein